MYIYTTPDELLVIFWFGPTNWLCLCKNKHEWHLWWDSEHHNELDIDENHVEDSAKKGNLSLPLEFFSARGGFLSKCRTLVILRVIHSLSHSPPFCQIQIVLPALFVLVFSHPWMKRGIWSNFQGFTWLPKRYSSCFCFGLVCVPGQ